jgi:anthranilate synthase/aminodeoxychorismate synthase-like glutamine amidotransferase
MILLIDNYDSFAHNLARYFQLLGQRTEIRRNDTVGLAEIRAMQPKAIVLSPGPCTPREAGISLEVVRQLHSQVPMLGVCLGHQVIAEALGGKVVRAPVPMHGQSSSISHCGERLFAELPNPLRVGRYHSLVVEEASMPSGLRCTARSADSIVMAIEHRSLPVFGVQFHPESILTEGGFSLLANFLPLAGLSQPNSAKELARRELTAPTVPEWALPVSPVTF